MTASIPFGVARLDQTLRDASVRAGIRQDEADELARIGHFGGTSPGPFLEGLRACAILANEGKPKALDWGTLPEPFCRLGPAMLAANGTPAFEVALEFLGNSVYPLDLQAALVGAMGSILVVGLPPQPAKPPPQPQSPPTPAGPLLAPPDPDLQRRILAALGKRKVSESQRRQQAGELLLDWLANPVNGLLVQTPHQGQYYLWRGQHQIFRLDSSRWDGWLQMLTGCNKAGPDHKWLQAHVTTAAEFHGERREVVRLAHWEEDHHILRVSRFNGEVYRLDGQSIELEVNGAGPALFEDSPMWLPYTPDFSGKGRTLDWSVELLPPWEQDRRVAGMAFRAWWLGAFFSELSPTKPVLILVGKKGSGKSTAARLILQLLFGPQVDLSGLPDKPDDFRASTANNHYIFFDNVDELSGWGGVNWQDKIASLATGKVDQLRQLYTTNDMAYIRFRCWLGMTSRTPDLLKRSDVAERTIVLPCRRLEVEDRGRELTLHQEARVRRNRWWGDVLQELNRTVWEIREHGLSEHSGFRMEDWAAVGEALARASGRGALWPVVIRLLRDQQHELMLKDNPVVDGVLAWLQALIPPPSPSKLKTADLFTQCKQALYPGGIADKGWPVSAKAFGRQLQGVEEELQARLAEVGWHMEWGTESGYRVYRFEEKGAQLCP